MEKIVGSVHNNSLRMANEDYYRKQAEFYRDSAAYLRMRNLYPVLQSSINDTMNEKLIT